MAVLEPFPSGQWSIVFVRYIANTFSSPSYRVFVVDHDRCIDDLPFSKWSYSDRQAHRQPVNISLFHRFHYNHKGYTSIWPVLVDTTFLSATSQCDGFKEQHASSTSFCWLNERAKADASIYVYCMETTTLAIPPPQYYERELEHL